ncbi:hypothetical protein WR164_00200 [Philodulcilactobacillus myokoensis]|uniref:AbrB/MazE/SpoVT family DNA-binding domain-containing protein n=1 Tax=Philodulcilactobacillus myokoensis TaxID=2929573 RepID=A0A9W6EQG1_9LACO|nr:AbrB family toxin-antitoxin system antitoxin [Philodulcilactobacillus myokoensis]GLB46041.1 hypothetical protein WR164_00200 [Philodulcilactobacillus myokoensis]
MFVKIRKTGNSKSLTVPKSFNMPDNIKMSVRKDKDGSIIYTPVSDSKNPFEGKWFNKKIKQDDISKNLKLSDKEWS